jgi:hypothetical protein
MHNHPTLTPDQLGEMQRLKQYFPFRIVFGAILPGGEFACGAVLNRREPNKLARNGAKVWTLDSPKKP